MALHIGGPAIIGIASFILVFVVLFIFIEDE